jgi:hypothetical protein
VAGGEFVGASIMSRFMSGCTMVGGSSESKLSGVAGDEFVGASKLSRFMSGCKMKCVMDSSVSTGVAGGEFVGRQPPTNSPRKINKTELSFEPVIHQYYRLNEALHFFVFL